MWACETEDIKFESAMPGRTITGHLFWDPAAPPRAILQISHGMCEYIGRYADLAAYMARQGFAVCGNDHLGHGPGCAPEDLGYFGPGDGIGCVLRDLRTMNQAARARWPGLPVFLLGHSMGSFFARAYAVKYPDTVDRLIISGTGGPNPASAAGMAVIRLRIAQKGDRHRSQLVNRLAFGSYLRRVPHPDTPYDWISRDKEIVRRYAADPLCTFTFTLNGFKVLVGVQDQVNRPEWARAMGRHPLPVLLFSGEEDPVGGYGKGVRRVYAMLRQAGLPDVTLTLYPGGRHEMLNETNRGQVYEDLLAWCQARL